MRTTVFTAFFGFVFLLLGLGQPSQALAGQNVFSVADARVLFNGQPFKVVGLRLSNALISDADTQELIDNLDVFKSFGVNAVSVFFMGSRFGDVKGFRPDATLDPRYAARMARIIEAADARGMIVLVGSLYWSTSRASEDLTGWTQQQANAAVANTVRWLSSGNYRNVFVDPDNEGMAHDAKGWSIASMIDAAHAVDRSIMVAYNDSASPPSNADLYIHHSPMVKGKPWIESEGEAPQAPGGYWGSYSKADGYYNYIRIGRYTPEMKAAQIAEARRTIADQSGYMMASTWLQAAPAEAIGGPFINPGGRSEIANVDAELRRLHPDAGVRWWLEAMRAAYGAWVPPRAAGTDAGPAAPDGASPREDARSASTDGALPSVSDAGLPTPRQDAPPLDAPPATSAGHPAQAPPDAGGRMANAPDATGAQDPAVRNPTAKGCSFGVGAPSPDRQTAALAVGLLVVAMAFPRRRRVDCR